ncbi:uncharacterized protein A1O5_03423 [Cladophialophora psammophila CBS 110553]|uniref:DUF7730 domain-containing protein n=1 Tax=Cladophialophora psammophila CBS 110553 TaxID=1182543 RepID=W9X9P9_9EURO|nr:uncharacterized protein A1O5_03423 [Cladophialophora psammophila CBS 110553]EXJ73661.1 hypothetical protein A1O5_03423 [Cladophialophora psammophila CBS 110553]
MTRQFSLSPSPALSPGITFLSLPVEVRLTIYTHLFYPAGELFVAPRNPAYDQGFNNDQETPAPPTWQVAMVPGICPEPEGDIITSSLDPYSQSSQLLRVCQQIYVEAIPILYGVNKFYCGLRPWKDNREILPRFVSTPNFAHIRHLVLDRPLVRVFAQLLAKEEHVVATKGLESVALGKWRFCERPTSTAVALGIRRPGTHFKGSQFCNPAVEICRKHAQLRYVVEQTKKINLELLCNGGAGENGESRKEAGYRTYTQCRWLLVTDRGARNLKEGEELVDLENYL